MTITERYDLALSIAAPLAVIISHVLQKLDAKHVKKALTKQTELTLRSDANQTRNINNIHQLVNGGLSDEKRITMMLARRIAEMTKSDADIAIANQTERDYIEHHERVTQQAVEGHYCPLRDCPVREQETKKG